MHQERLKITRTDWNLSIVSTIGRLLWTANRPPAPVFWFLILCTKCGPLLPVAHHSHFKNASRSKITPTHRKAILLRFWFPDTDVVVKLVNVSFAPRLPLVLQEILISKRPKLLILKDFTSTCSGTEKDSFNPLTPRTKPWVILTFDCMDRTLKCDHS